MKGPGLRNRGFVPGTPVWVYEACVSVTPPFGVRRQAKRDAALDASGRGEKPAPVLPLQSKRRRRFALPAHSKKAGIPFPDVQSPESRESGNPAAVNEESGFRRFAGTWRLEVFPVFRNAFLLVAPEVSVEL